jgi:hypothetical protein
MYVNDGFLYDENVETIVESQIGVDTFLVRNYAETVPVAPMQYWVLRDNNLYISYRLRDADAYQIECKFGRPAGTKWTVVKGGAPYTYSIEANKVSITTGEGVVNDAVKIKIKSAGGAESYQYFSPTPSLFILDDKKKIIAKKIPAEKLEEFFTNYERFHPRSQIH